MARYIPATSRFSAAYYLSVTNSVDLAAEISSSVWGSARELLLNTTTGMQMCWARFVSPGRFQGTGLDVASLAQLMTVAHVAYNGKSADECSLPRTLPMFYGDVRYFGNTCSPTVMLTDWPARDAVHEIACAIAGLHSFAFSNLFERARSGSVLSEIEKHEHTVLDRASKLARWCLTTSAPVGAVYHLSESRPLISDEPGTQRVLPGFDHTNVTDSVVTDLDTSLVHLQNVAADPATDQQQRAVILETVDAAQNLLRAQVAAQLATDAFVAGITGSYKPWEEMYSWAIEEYLFLPTARSRVLAYERNNYTNVRICDVTIGELAAFLSDSQFQNMLLRNDPADVYETVVARNDRTLQYMKLPQACVEWATRILERAGAKTVRGGDLARTGAASVMALSDVYTEVDHVTGERLLPGTFVAAAAARLAVLMHACVHCGRAAYAAIDHATSHYAACNMGALLWLTQVTSISHLTFSMQMDAVGAHRQKVLLGGAALVSGLFGLFRPDRAVPPKDEHDNPFRAPVLYRPRDSGGRRGVDAALSYGNNSVTLRKIPALVEAKKYQLQPELNNLEDISAMLPEPTAAAAAIAAGAPEPQPDYTVPDAVFAPVHDAPAPFEPDTEETQPATPPEMARAATVSKIDLSRETFTEIPLEEFRGRMKTLFETVLRTKFSIARCQLTPRRFRYARTPARQSFRDDSAIHTA